MMFQHIGLSVANLERSISFYRDLVGLEFLRVIECPADSNLGKVGGLNPCAASNE
jgi:catechol 2,3-dioxygenase-like lactoylglutathione lyase family enzyme